MPKLDLVNALQIKGSMGEVLQLKGPGFSWAKPIAPSVPWSFLDNIAGLSGYTVNSRTADTIVFSRSELVRSHLIFDWNMPTGTRLRFRYTKVGPALLWSRTCTDTAGMNVAQNIFGQSNPRSVDLVLNSSPYWGFLTGSNEPSDLTTYTIDQLIVNLP